MSNLDSEEPVVYIVSHEVFWKAVSTYSRLRRSLCDSFYCLPYPLEESKQYRDFVLASNRIYEIAAKPEDFVMVQFKGADMVHYPRPKDLRHPKAEDRWRLYERNKTLEAHVNQQEIYMSKLRDRGLSDEEIACSDLPLASWYRLLLIDSPSEALIEEGLDQLRNPRLFEIVSSRGYDVRKIMRWKERTK